MTEQTHEPEASQVISGESSHATGAGVHVPEQEQKPEEPKRLSTRDAIEAALADQDKAVKPEAKAEEAKPEEAAKPEKVEKARATDGKFTKAEDQGAKPATDAEVKAPAGQAEPEQQRPSEGRGKHSEPPARFLPEARAKWDNVPNEIKAEFHRISTEADNENTRMRQTIEPLRPFMEMAQRSGTTIDKAMQAYVGMENMLRQDFGKGVAELAKNAGMTPQQAIGHVMRAYGIAPAQLAQAAQQNPHAFAAPQARPQPAQQQSPREAQLQRENEQLRQQAASATILPAIEAFAASKPDYPQLEASIARILRGGQIEQEYGPGLPAETKLELAYRMAAALKGASSVPSAPSAPAHSEASPQTDPAGSLSVRGAPGAGQTQTQKRFKSNREALEAAFSNL